MSLVTQMLIAENFGLRVSIEQLADILKMARGTIYNQISAGTFPIHTFVDGKARFADYRDVAAYVDSCRSRVKVDAGIPA